MLKKMITMAMLSSALFGAHQIGININDKEVGGDVRFDMGRMQSTSGNGYIGLRFLNGDNNNSKTIADPNPLMEVSLMVMGPVQGVQGLKLGLGIKGEYTEIDGKRYAAVPLGLKRSCGCRLMPLSLFTSTEPFITPLRC
jgi:hypothetical protein